MKIILKEDVYNLGEEGDICDVARGYARNYLFPQGYAVTYTKENIAIFESKKAAIEKRKEEKRKAAASIKERLEGMEIQIPMNVGEGGKLFGSVTSAMIVEELAKEGIELEKKQVDVPSSSIKMTGTYKVEVKLYESDSAEINLKVVDQHGKTGEEESESETSSEESDKSTGTEEVNEEDTETAAAAESSAEGENE